MLEYNGVDYIYVGDIGNNYDGHCRGINYEDMAIYRFPEPELSSYKYDSNLQKYEEVYAPRNFLDSKLAIFLLLRNLTYLVLHIGSYSEVIPKIFLHSDF